MFIPNKLISNKDGITLIEILITISVLSIGILGPLQAFPYAMKAQRTIELQTIGNHLAQEKFEELFSLSYDQISVGVIEDNQRASSDQSNPLYHFTRTTIIELVDENMLQSQSDIGFKKITTTVYWPKPLDNENNNISLITLISKL